ncbi:hypothetical protein HPB51_016664 [Rhipicephalus microplus]|uniref:Uncharacterized protein n=1 Tax=Rhipicephalus microplus TaxID=6941 RepID=A0A9J6DP28_RHIMP|nr:hypothetical protein HPB51_016664 [Rhipicephalus microplus]
MLELPSEQQSTEQMDKKLRKQRLRPITRGSRMSPLPREEYKMIVKPRGGLRVSDHGAARIANSVNEVANTPREVREQDTICLNYHQNTVVVSQVVVMETYLFI